MKATFLGLASALVLSSALLPAQARADARETKVDALFTQWSGQKPGCSVAAAQDGKVLLAKGYGMANLEYDIPNRRNTVFHIASISKQFTAAAIARLIVDGKIKIDDDIRKYVPEMADFGTPITVGHLVHHTSGIRDQWDVLNISGYSIYRDRIADPDVMRVLTRQKRLNFRPGDKYSYSNSGYTLMAQIVERVSGKTLRQFMDERFFKPLGMKDTFFRDDFGEITKNFASAYERSADGSFRTSLTQFDTVGPTSILTTVDDLLRWDASFTNATFGQAFVDLMYQRPPLNDGKPNRYAFGLYMPTYRGAEVIEHSGGDAGYGTHMMRFPQHKLTVVALCNTYFAGAEEIAKQMVDIYLEGKLGPAEPLFQWPDVRTPTTAEKARMTGDYVAKDGSTLRIAGNGDGLWAGGWTPPQKLEMRPNGEITGDDGFAVRIETKASGPAQKILVRKSEGASFTAFTRTSSPAPAPVDSLAGTYFSDEIEIPYHIVVKDGRAFLDAIKRNALPLTPLPGDTWVTDEGMRLVMQRASGGSVTGFAMMSWEGEPYRFVRAR